MVSLESVTDYFHVFRSNFGVSFLISGLLWPNHVFKQTVSTDILQMWLYDRELKQTKLCFIWLLIN